MKQVRLRGASGAGRRGRHRRDAPPPEPEPAGPGRILIVDDEPAIRTAVVRMLKEHEVVEADAGASIRTHAGDAKAGVAFLGRREDVDAKRIGLIGHSEGGIIAAIVAAELPDIAFVVSLAGTGLPGARINPMQIEAILKADEKATPEAIKTIVDLQKELMAMVEKDADLAPA